jgi:membrane-associated protein
MPALAGAFHLHYATFLRFNTLGVILGISQFILLGFFFGSHLETMLDWFGRYGLPITTILVLLAMASWLWLSWHRAKRQG